MVSTLVHAALAGFIAAALLGDRFGPKSLAVVLGAVILVDFDTFLGLYIEGAHRAAFHTLLLPVVLASAIAVDTRYRDQSILRERFGDGSPRVAWVTVAAILFAGIGPDLFFNGVNLFYPIHDQFYQLTGQMKLSSTEGFVQTFVDLSPSETGGNGGRKVAVGSTDEVGDRYYTGVDPQPSKPGAESGETERTFPLVTSGEQLLLVLTSVFVVGARLFEERRP
jgi:inner membrane protein